MQKEPRKRPGFVRAVVTNQQPGGKAIGKTVRVREFRARDRNWMNKMGLSVIPEPITPTMPTVESLPQPEPVTPQAPKAEKIEPMKPQKVKI